MEPLQMHPNHQIYERVLKILEAYFADDNAEIMLDTCDSLGTAAPKFNF